MYATAQKLPSIKEGVDKASFINSLHVLSDQTRRVDQTFALKVEEMVERDYNTQHQRFKRCQKFQME